MKRIIPFFLLLITLSCKEEKKPIIPDSFLPKKTNTEFGYLLDDFNVIKDTIRSGENFGEILDRNHVSYAQINKIVTAIKDTFDVRRLRAGKPYTILASKDSLQKAQVFIYQKNIIDFVVIDFKDTIVQASVNKKEVQTVVKTASGVIQTSLSEAIDKQGLNYILAHELSDIYAWTIDFFHLQKQDKFKIIYEQRYINDTLPAGIGEIKAVYFEHNKEPFYAFNYIADSIKGIPDYFDDHAKTLRKKFLKAPLKFSRISSRYNPNRRIKYYGYKKRPHLGTDFAAPLGTPILATANGTVVESTRRGGNGKFVKIKHNGTYTTQYLHMKKQAVKKGDFVKQGDVIGWIGMTGNSGGPHVCYRFWKNGKQVDPFKEKLPEAKPLNDSIKKQYLEYIKPVKKAIDAITYPLEEVPFQEDNNLPI